MGDKHNDQFLSKCAHTNTKYLILHSLNFWYYSKTCHLRTLWPQTSISRHFGLLRSDSQHKTAFDRETLAKYGCRQILGTKCVTHLHHADLSFALLLDLFMKVLLYSLITVLFGMCCSLQKCRNLQWGDIFWRNKGCPHIAGFTVVFFFPVISLFLPNWFVVCT